MIHYKGHYIVKSNKVEGMYMTICEHVVGWSIEEVKYDINDTAKAHEYDMEVNETKSLLNSFESFLK